MRKKYFTEEEQKAAKREYQKRWREKNPDYRKRWYQKNTEKCKGYQKQYRKTPMGRALNLLNRYQQNDKEMGRGECTLTAEWIVENIFSKPCHYCGETDWRKIGCDRIDNDLPHTPDNVVPCCEECNKKRQKKIYDEFKKEMGLTSPS